METDSDHAWATRNDHWAITKTDIYKITYKWTINNFSLHGLNIGDKITSPVFSAKEEEGTEFELLLYPCGVDREATNHLSIFLSLRSSTRKQINVKIIFTLVSNSKNKNDNYSKCCICKFNVFGRMGIARYISRDHLLSDEYGHLLPNDVLTVFCKIHMLSEPKNVYGKFGKYLDEGLEDLSNENCLNDFRNLFEEETLSDVILCVEGKEIRAHKAILAARSPVFCAMFSHDMKETQQSKAIITDINYETLKRVLAFIYCGKLLDVEHYAKDLLIAADKYDIQYLKELAERHIKKCLTVENASEYLIWADNHNIQNLKFYLLEFTRGKNLAQMLETEGWKSMVKTHPHLVEEIFRSLVVTAI